MKKARQFPAVTAIFKIDLLLSLISLVAFWSSSTLMNFIPLKSTGNNIVILSTTVLIVSFLMLKAYRWILPNIRVSKRWRLWQLLAFSVDTALVVGISLVLLNPLNNVFYLLSFTLFYASVLWLGSSSFYTLTKYVLDKKNRFKQIHTIVASSNLQAYQNEIVLITGAAGTIGSELAWQLSNTTKLTLILLDQSELGLQQLMQRCTNCKATLIPFLGSITKRQQIEQLFNSYKPTIVFHAAAYKQLPILEQYPAEAVNTNIGGTLHLVDAAYNHQTARFIFISTDKAVNPSSVLGMSKKIAEAYVQFKLNTATTTQWAVVRFGNVWNSNGSVLPLWEQQLAANAAIEVRNPEATRYFIEASQVAHLLSSIGLFTHLNKSYLLQMGEAITLGSLAAKFIKKQQWSYIPKLTIQQSKLVAGEKLHEILIADDEFLTKSPHPLVYEIDQSQSNGVFSLEKLEQLLTNSNALNSDDLKDAMRTFF